VSYHTGRLAAIWSRPSGWRGGLKARSEIDDEEFWQRMDSAEPDVNVQSPGRPGPPETQDAGAPVRHDLELPHLWRLLLTAGWNFAESLGLPGAGYVVGAALGGQAVGMVVATGVLWITAAIRKAVTHSIPGMLAISALVLTLQTVLVVATGSTLIFLLQFPLANLVLCVLFARTARSREPLVARLAAEVVGLRQPSSRNPGLDRFFRGVTWLWAAIFAISALWLAAELAVAPARVVLLLATVATVGGVLAGALLSILWFRRVLHRSGLRLRFTSA
jgi:hypothetical protein